MIALNAVLDLDRSVVPVEKYLDKRQSHPDMLRLFGLVRPGEQSGFHLIGDASSFIRDLNDDLFPALIQGNIDLNAWDREIVIFCSVMEYIMEDLFKKGFSGNEDLFLRCADIEIDLCLREGKHHS